jgi:hypothetical protein
MSDDAQLGTAITDAMRFLRKIHQDIGELLTALDGVMAERGWQATEKSRISETLSNGSDSKRWVLDYLFRCYLQAGTRESVEQLVVFFILLDVPTSLDQPWMLGAVGRFDPPMTYDTINAQWDDTTKAVEALCTKPGPRMLLANEVDTFLPAANDVFGTVVPLCSIGSAQSLVTQLVEPLLNSARKPVDVINLREPR